MVGLSNPPGNGMAPLDLVTELVVHMVLDTDMGVGDGADDVVLVGDNKVVGSGDDGGKLSYVAAVTGLKMGDKQDSSVFLNDEVCVLDEDVRILREGKFTIVQFSDRVHDMFDQSMRTSVIVRLLGRRNGYGALLTRIKSLWQPKGKFQLIDIENDYFAVRFALETNYEGAVGSSNGSGMVKASVVSLRDGDVSTVTSHETRIHDGSHATITISEMGEGAQGTAWQEHPGFTDFIIDKWDPDGEASYNMSFLQTDHLGKRACGSRKLVVSGFLRVIGILNTITVLLWLVGILTKSMPYAIIMGHGFRTRVSYNLWQWTFIRTYSQVKDVMAMNSLGMGGFHELSLVEKEWFVLPMDVLLYIVATIPPTASAPSDEPLELSDESILETGRRLVQHVIVAKGYHANHACPRVLATRGLSSWVRPEEGWFSLCSDGVRRQGDGCVAYGDVIQNDQVWLLIKAERNSSYCPLVYRIELLVARD
ncbi:hypothetical protein V6N11_082743 [Hibiscus sabdariffa]|uniref:Uncharacterized protein n=1 Tax=Hibiscus sabdariffa TaxID=183260 RepID=A0ABR2QJT7_9ROSI